MQKIVLFCIPIFLLLTSCGSSTTPTSNTKKTVIFKGKIENATQSKLMVSTPYDRMEVPVTKGEFEVEMPLEVATIADFQYYRNNWKAFGKPGEMIDMSFKEGDFDKTFQVSKYGKATQFMRELEQQLRAVQQNFERLFTQDEADFSKTLDSLNFAGMAKVLQYNKANPDTDATIKQWLNFMVVYAGGELLELYPNIHQMVTQDTTYQPSPAYFAAQQTIKSERPELLGHPNYYAYLQAKLSNLSGMEWDKLPKATRSNSDYPKVQMQVIDQAFTNEKIKEVLRYMVISDHLNYSGVNGIQPLLEKYQQTATLPFYKNKLQKMYDEWAHLEKGKTAPDFTYPDLQQTLHSLSDYRGKYVYIDVWATWCGPCLAEQPALAKIEETYKDNPNIVFMGVSTDQNKPAWENMLNDRKLKGVQLLAGNASQAGISKDYNISGIPRFILVDKAGNIINANAERPSSPALRAQLAELLED